jgi:hypothetical protein
MGRISGSGAILAVALLASGLSAHAQYYHYPAGYGGWGGWGGANTVAGSTAAGMGNFAAGAGAYNLQTAQARSINAQTAMSMNEYMYDCQTNRNINYYKTLASRRQELNQSQDAIYRRLHDNPNAGDIQNGDALNVVLDELKNPKVWNRVIQAATQAIPSRLIKNVPFQHASSAVTISLEQLNARGVPEQLATNPAFEDDRQAIRKIATAAREESADGKPISDATLQRARAAIKTLQGKVASTLEPGSRDRREAENFLKGLYGLTKMLEYPKVGPFLKDLDQISTTDLAHLLTFMHSFNLRFGATTEEEQKAAYNQLYPLLVAVRDQVLMPQGPAQLPVATQPDPRKATAFFSDMQFDHFGPQPSPHTGAAPAPPKPGANP